MTSFELALKSFSRYRFATVITVLAIALSVGASGILYRVYRTSELRFQSLALGADALVGAKSGGVEMVLGALGGEGPYPDFIPSNLVATLQADLALHFPDANRVEPPKLRTVTPLLIFAKFDRFRVVGTDKSFLSSRSSQTPYSLAVGRWIEQAGEVVVGSEVAKRKKLTVGDSIEVSPWFGGNPLSSVSTLRIAGVLSQTYGEWDLTVFSNIDDAQATLERYAPLTQRRSIWGSKVYHYAMVNLDMNHFLGLQTLINQRSVAQVVRVEAALDQLRNIGGVGRALGLLITGFVLTLGGLAVLSTLASRFETLAPQIAVLRAIGYRKVELVSWFLWEAFFLVGSGLIFGALIDALLFPYFLLLIKQAVGTELSTIVGLSESLPIWIAAVCATLFSVVIPAVRLTRQSAHDALRGF